MSGYVRFQSDTADVWNILNQASGRIAFDIGANGGLVASVLATHFETVLAVEPAVESYTQLQDTAPPNVRPLNVAVSNYPGPITLRETTLTASLGELFTGDSLPWGGHVGWRQVEAVTLDALTDDYGHPDFVKIDTEGHEVDVLRGGRVTFAAHPLFVIECHSANKGAAVQIMLEKAGLDYQIHYHDGYREASPHRLEHYWVTSPTERFL